MHTGVLGRGQDLGKELGEVRQVLAQEAGLDDKSFTSVGSSQLTTKEFGLAGDAKSRAFLSALLCILSAVVVVFFGYEAML